MNSPSPELEQLVTAYVAGETSRAQVERLTRLLDEEQEARDYFLARMDLHAGMATDESLRSGEGAVEDSGVIRLDSALDRGKSTADRRRWVVPAMAACAAGLVLLVVFLLNQGGDPKPGPVVKDPVAPGYFAVMTDAEEAVWKMDSHVPRDVGEAVGAMKAELVSGRAEFQFGSGARVAIAGPAVLEFLSPNRARLHRGQLTAIVPEPARGFTVEIDGAEVVDLGTEFALNCDGRDTTEVHVYNGEVVVIPDKRSGSGPLTLRTNDTKRLETREGLVEDALFATERFLRMHRRADTPEPSGDIRFLHRGPRSVLHGAFEHSAYVLLFRERAGVVLDRDVQVNATGPGTYRTRRKPEDPPGTAVVVEVGHPETESLGVLSAGTEVTSYFVHFDPARGGGGKGVHRSGSIRFREPILGVIMATRHLVPTDAVFGLPGTRYETTDFAITRNGLEPDDRVTLDEDGRTIHLKLGAGTSVDHLRVLVEAKPPAQRGSDGAGERR